MQDELVPELEACPNPWCRPNSTRNVCRDDFVRADVWGYRVKCSCGLRGPTKETEAEARAAWNKRTDHAGIAAAAKVARDEAANLEARWREESPGPVATSLSGSRLTAVHIAEKIEALSPIAAAKVDEAGALIEEAARLIAPGDGEAVFYIRVGGEHTQLQTKAKGIDPQTALPLAMEVLRAELADAKACPYHASPAVDNATVDREKAAERIFASMRRAALKAENWTAPPEWVPGGNSLMQDEARACADDLAALSVSNETPSEVSYEERLNYERRVLAGEVRAQTVLNGLRDKLKERIATIKDHNQDAANALQGVLLDIEAIDVTRELPFPTDAMHGSRGNG